MYAVYTKENGGGRFLRYVVDGSRHCSSCRDVDHGRYCRDRGHVSPIAAAMCGNLVLVADDLRHRVSAFRYDDGAFVRHVANTDGRTWAMAVYADRLVLMADVDNRRVSVFDVWSGAFVRHLQHAEMKYPNGVAVYGDLAVISDGKNAELAVFRIGDGALVRRIDMLGDIVARRGGNQVPRTVVTHGVAMYGDVVFVADVINLCMMVVRISDGALVPSAAAARISMRITNDFAVHGDLLLVTDVWHGRVRAYHIADGTLAYSIDDDGCENGKTMYPYSPVVYGNALLACDKERNCVGEFSLPAVVRWRPDADAHGQFGAAFRVIIQAVLGIASRGAASSLSRLPLELVCVVASELAQT